MHAIRWPSLLPESRDGDPVDDSRGARSPFQRDHDRILFSGPFRRLADKTQVFPLPVDDHVHSRLTHSLEVATIGRSLGTLVGRRLVASGVSLPEGRDARDVGDCVAAACLAHDLGNPPFGHVGETAIQEYFRSRAPASLLEGLSRRERLDFERFEGNAQAFRILSRLERPQRGAGLALTHATLGAFMKYPCTSEAADPDGPAPAHRKHGVLASELDRWEAVAGSLGLPRPDVSRAAWSRHPLAHLTEAADDVAYLLLDLEDGFRLRLVGAPEFERLLSPIASAPAPTLEAIPDEYLERLEWAGQLRGQAIERLLHQLAEAFVHSADRILDGSFTDSLTRVIPLRDALREVRRACRVHCYEARDVLKMEATGIEAIQGLLDFHVQALVLPERAASQRVRKLLPHVFEPGLSRYDALLRITDHVAGMTDNYAVRLYRELRGMRYPGGRD
jgi:dGTPase